MTRPGEQRDAGGMGKTCPLAIRLWPAAGAEGLTCAVVEMAGVEE